VTLTDWFEWKGTRCTVHGIHVSEHPAITFPAERITNTAIPGKSGNLTSLEGAYVYDDMLLTVTCWIESLDQLDAVAHWLRGSGTVRFANRSSGFYYARVCNQIPFDRILRGNPQRSFSVTFRSKPFLYLDDSPDEAVTSSGSVITNPGAVDSEPLIRVYGSGDITLMVGIEIVELEDISSQIFLDSEIQEAYKGTSSMNSHMSGEFPKLLPGMNAISWTGNVTSLVITPRWRTL
jgi:phage-related protein